MAFPAAPTESGTAKIHFLTTDGNAAAGWVAIETGTTGTGSNTVGWAGVATHVEGDEVADPGDITTSAAPVVLVAGDNASGNAGALQLDGSDFLRTVIEPNSFAAIEGAALGEGVLLQGDDTTDRKNINVDATTGDIQVDITEVVPGFGAADLGKREDDIHASLDVGVQMLAVRKATPVNLSGSDGDYEPPQIDTGSLWVKDNNLATVLGTSTLITTTQADNLANSLDGLNTTTFNYLYDGTNWDRAVATEGTKGAGVLRVNLATDDNAVAALEIMDDWDESSRAKVNPIVGQAGIAAGAGTVGVTVPRMTLASNDPAVTALELIDDAIYVDDADWTDDSSKHMLVGGVFETTPQTITAGDVGPIELTTHGAVHVAGDVAHNAADSGGGGPVKIGGGPASSSEPAAVDANDRVNAWFDRIGRQVTVEGHANPDGPVTATLAGTAVTIIAAPAGGTAIFVTGIQASNGDNVKLRLDIKDGAGGTVLKSMWLAADGGGYTANFRPFMKLTAATLCEGIMSGTPSENDVRVNIDYYVAPDP